MAGGSLGKNRPISNPRSCCSGVAGRWHHLALPLRRNPPSGPAFHLTCDQWVPGFHRFMGRRV